MVIIRRKTSKSFENKYPLESRNYGKGHGAGGCY
jgi:hypothetical protein